MPRAICMFCLLTALLLASYLPASAFGWFPPCGSPEVHASIISRFNAAYTRAIHDGASIRNISGDREHVYEAFGRSPILRRYCKAEAWMNHRPHKPHRLYYRIEERMGLAGIGWKVEFCVPGHDNWRVFNGDCRVLRKPYLR